MRKTCYLSFCSDFTDGRIRESKAQSNFYPKVELIDLENYPQNEAATFVIAGSKRIKCGGNFICAETTMSYT